MTIHHAALARMLPAEKKEKLLRQLAQSGVSPSRIPIIKADPAQAIPLSFNQERLWFLQKYDSTPPATNYNLYVVYRLHGVVDMPMLTEALRHVQARHAPSLRHVQARHAILRTRIMPRHAILRTRIIVRNDRPCQVIDDASSLVLDTVTLAAQAPTSALDAVIQQVINTRFDLARGPLWGVTQIIQPDQGCHLVFCAHHIIIDGISLRLLFDELQQQYARLHAGNETSLPRRCLRRRCNMPIMPSGSANGSRIPCWRTNLPTGVRVCKTRLCCRHFHRCTRARHNPLHMVPGSASPWMKH